MKEFVFKNKVYGFPEAWEELTAEEFITVCGLLQRFVKGEIDMDTFKFLAVGHITGYKPHWWPPKRKRQEVNLLLLAEKFNFMFDVVDTEAKLNVFFRENIISKFEFGGFVFTGPMYLISESNNQYILETDMTAEQFINAIENYNLYTKSGGLEDLRRLVSKLYKVQSTKYDEKKYKVQSTKYKVENERFEVGLQIAGVNALPEHFMFGVFLVFKSFMEFITNKSVFKLLWGGEPTGKLNLGIGEMVLGLVKQGYGTANEVGGMVITDFMFAMLKERFDGAREMKLYDKTTAEIVKATGLPENVILEL